MTVVKKQLATVLESALASQLTNFEAFKVRCWRLFFQQKKLPVIHTFVRSFIHSFIHLFILSFFLCRINCSNCHTAKFWILKKRRFCGQSKSCWKQVCVFSSRNKKKGKMKNIQKSLIHFFFPCTQKPWRSWKTRSLLKVSSWYVGKGYVALLLHIVLLTSSTPFFFHLLQVRAQRLSHLCKGAWFYSLNNKGKRTGLIKVEFCVNARLRVQKPMEAGTHTHTHLSTFTIQGRESERERER